MEITENIENEAEAARSPGEVKKEIRKLRHKAERPLYWILFVMNILILLCAFVFTMAMQSSDLSGFIRTPSDHQWRNCLFLSGLCYHCFSLCVLPALCQ